MVSGQGPWFHASLCPGGRWGWGLVITECSDESESSTLAGKTRTGIQMERRSWPSPSPSPHLGPHGPATLSYRLHGWLCEPGLPIKRSPTVPSHSKLARGWTPDSTWSNDFFSFGRKRLKGDTQGSYSLNGSWRKIQTKRGRLQDGGRAQTSAFETLGQVMPEVSTFELHFWGLKICLFL